jgi:hypothetical protein
LFSAFSSEALTTRTTNVINGSAPYLTFDGGVTKVTDTEGLLGITIPGIGHVTRSSHPSSRANPIEMVNDSVRFSDIDMFVPLRSNTVSLNSLISLGYWRDDDGDGRGSGGITATGQLTLTITDKDNQSVTRGETLTRCKSPYTLTLASTGGTLRTRYGVPRSSTFDGGTAIYYLKPKASPAVCFAKPDMYYASGNFAGSPAIWNPAKGFLVQSTVPSDYHRNFPTTGAHNLYFDLDIGGVDATSLSWPNVVHPSGITVELSATSATTVRAKLVGPHADTAQINSNTPTPIAVPNLSSSSVPPFEIVGRDSSGNDIITYGFKLKQWFVNKSSDNKDYDIQKAWCSSIGYQVPRVRDLTNAVNTSRGHAISGAFPSSSGNYLMRHIGAGFFTEWGFMNQYTDANFFHNGYWVSDVTGSNQYIVYTDDGRISYGAPNSGYHRNIVCTSALSP